MSLVIRATIFQTYFVHYMTIHVQKDALQVAPQSKRNCHIVNELNVIIGWDEKQGKPDSNFLIWKCRYLEDRKVRKIQLEISDFSLNN